ncbi:unnamed protein product [Rotaria sp. Silwood1]|nr:unnamed protein product [Rotaria sp. Silwood1]
MIPLSIRPLVEKKLSQMKSSDPHAVLASLLNNNINDVNVKQEQIEEYQSLRLDLWDMPGSTSSTCITHQVFLSPRAIYLLVFDLTKDLDQPADWNEELTNLDHLSFIMHSVYCYSANINQGRIQDEELNIERLSPPIIIIGTHRNSFSSPTKKKLL